VEIFLTSFFIAGFSVHISDCFYMNAFTLNSSIDVFYDTAAILNSINVYGNILYGALGANGRKNCRLWSCYIESFRLISVSSLCCIALTEYMLCILWITHDFIALKITFL
jgi:hypothetical protein